MEGVQKPRNFSWVIPGELAAMGWPNSPETFRFLIQEGIKHLVTLSPDHRPPNIHVFPEIDWTEIKIAEFYAPGIHQIEQFITLCEKAREKHEPVGVHCWMGRGRTGVMLACYMVRFANMSPERAIDHVRMMRNGSVETYDQERIVVKYNDYLCSVRD